MQLRGHHKFERLKPSETTHALHTAGINLSPFTEDFSVWGALNDCHLAVSQLLNRKQTESFPAAAKGSKRQKAKRVQYDLD